MKELFIKILRFLMFVLVVALGCIGYNIYEDTLAAVWIPVGVGLVVAVVTLPLYKKWIWLTTMEQKAVNILCHVVCVGVISCSLFLVGNYQMAAPASTKEVTVTVLEKLIKEHEKRRKVGKHRYVSDGVRKEYYLKVAFEDGAIETLHVSTATYNKARKGKPKVLTLQKGGFCRAFAEVCAEPLLPHFLLGGFVFYNLHLTGEHYAVSFFLKAQTCFRIGCKLLCFKTVFAGCQPYGGGSFRLDVAHWNGAGISLLVDGSDDDGFASCQDFCCFLD